MYQWWQQIQWTHLWVLNALPLFVIGWLWYHAPRVRASFTSLPTLQRLPPSGLNGTMLHRTAYWFLFASCLSLLIALAGPNIGNQVNRLKGKGIDIMLCFDISGSMLERDFQPNRLEAAKEVARRFIKERSGDRLGITIFSSQSFTLCPLTTDQTTLLQQIDAIESGYLQDDGTAIGSGLATSVDRLRNSESKSRIIILLTDGVDFGGQIPPDKARDMASLFKIKVYTVGVGTIADTDEVIQTENGPIVRKKKLEFNEGLLQNIAQVTGGKYFHAKDQETLAMIYKSISQLEKSDIRTDKLNRNQDQAPLFIRLAGILALLAFILRFVAGKTLV